MMRTFYFFAYGTLRSTNAASHTVLENCAYAGTATVRGTLYDIDGEYPALMLYGETAVQGDLWRCPVTMLQTLDTYENTETGLFRRVATNVILTEPNNEHVPCWIYVAGPRLAHLLTPQTRIASGVWSR
jgi:gamma-glutamylcyclotransferase (GGCT)/AIG2-like uncharacterized protein YtfP